MSQDYAAQHKMSHDYGVDHKEFANPEGLDIPMSEAGPRPDAIGEPAHAEHGPGVDHQIPQAEAIQKNPDLAWSKIRRFMREPFAEFFGTFILIMFGDGVVAQVVLSGGKAGSWISINWGS